MKLRVCLLCALLAALTASCAAKKNEAGVDKTLFHIDFGFKSVNKCAESPEINMQNVPQGTKKAEVKVLDMDFGLTIYDNTLGFETTDTGLFLKDTSGKIPEGKLKEFRGPCPGDKPHDYKVEVRAKDENGQELGRASVTKTVAP